MGKQEKFDDYSIRMLAEWMQKDKVRNVKMGIATLTTLGLLDGEMRNQWLAIAALHAHGQDDACFPRNMALSLKRTRQSTENVGK